MVHCAIPPPDLLRKPNTAASSQPLGTPHSSMLLSPHTLAASATSRLSLIPLKQELCNPRSNLSSYVLSLDTRRRPSMACFSRRSSLGYSLSARRMVTVISPSPEKRNRSHPPK